MFKRQEEISMSKNVGGQETIIAQGVKVEGDFTSEGNVFIELSISKDSWMDSLYTSRSRKLFIIFSL